MSPEQIDTVINAVAAAYYEARPYVPGLLLAAALWAVVWVCRLVCRAWRAAGRTVAEILDRRQWQQSTAADEDPHLDVEFDELGQHLKTIWDRIHPLYADDRRQP